MEQTYNYNISRIIYSIAISMCIVIILYYVTFIGGIIVCLSCSLLYYIGILHIDNKENGSLGAIIRYTIGVHASILLNPYVLYQVIMQVVCSPIPVLRYQGKLPSVQSYKQKTRFTLPVTGAWYVYNGGVLEESSHSWHILNQRYAYDLIVRDHFDSTYTGKGREPNNYHAFGEAVLAPAPGVVERISNRTRDFEKPKPLSGRIDWKTRDFRGNFVVIRHAVGEYSLFAHLRRGSICVNKGDHVERGQQIAQCGNSGHSTEPHLHFQIQDRPNFYTAMSLPIQFVDLDINQEFYPAAYLEYGKTIHNRTRRGEEFSADGAASKGASSAETLG